MTNKELQEKIARLETELAEVKKTAEAMKKKADGGLFKPEYGQVYSYIMHSGIVTNDQWNDHCFDRSRYEIGNCYPTKQAAEDTVRVLKLVQKAKESQGGFIPDWEDMLQNKYSVRFFTGDIEISVCQLHNEASMFGYWEYRYACEQFVKDNREELLWFFSEKR